MYVFYIQIFVLQKYIYIYIWINLNVTESKGSVEN